MRLITHDTAPGTAHHVDTLRGCGSPCWQGREVCTCHMGQPEAASACSELLANDWDGAELHALQQAQRLARALDALLAVVLTGSLAALLAAAWLTTGGLPT